MSQQLVTQLAKLVIFFRVFRQPTSHVFARDKLPEKETALIKGWWRQGKSLSNYLINLVTHLIW